jgi:hypothetical protein
MTKKSGRDLEVLEISIVDDNESLRVSLAAALQLNNFRSPPRRL